MRSLSPTRRSVLKAGVAAALPLALGIGPGAGARAAARPPRLFVPGYRSGEAARDGSLIVDTPGVLRAPSGWDGPRTLLSIVDPAAPDTAMRIAAYPLRGHAVTPIPGAGVGIFASMEGRTIVGFDLDTLDLAVLAPPSRAGWTFGGHAVVLPDGRHVAIAERAPATPASGDLAADLERLSGRIVIRDAVSLAPVGEFSSFGLRPHDMAVTADGRHLVVANYGSTAAPDQKAGEPVIPWILAPGAAVIELASGRLVERIAGAEGSCELRHLVAPALDRVFAVTARVVRSTDDPDNPPDPAAEPGLDYAPALPLKVTGGRAVPLMSGQAAQARHGLSIAFDPAADEVLVSFPPSHLVAVFDAASGATRKLIRTDEMGLQWPCGIALSQDRRHWHVTGYRSGLLTLRTGSHAFESLAVGPTWWGHSHIAVA